MAGTVACDRTSIRYTYRIQFDRLSLWYGGEYGGGTVPPLVKSPPIFLVTIPRPYRDGASGTVAGTMDCHRTATR